MTKPTDTEIANAARELERRRLVREGAEELLSTIVTVRETKQGFAVEIEGDFKLTFAALQQLSIALGTTLIDINHEAGDPGYSEGTPGYPGETTLYVRWPK